MSSPPTSIPSTTDDKGPGAIRVCTSLTIVCTVFVGLRLWARRYKRTPFAADDYMILVSLTLVYGMLATIIIAVLNGLGQNVVVVAATIPNGVTNVLKCLLATEMAYGTSLVTVKTSVLLMYYNIFPTRPFRIAAFVIGIITIMWWIAIMLVFIFQCTPIAMAWDKTLAGHCIDNNKFYIGNAVPNILTNLAILALPAREVWNLQMPRSQKVAICGIFMMGGLIVIISIVRLISLFHLSAEDPNSDITSIHTIPWIWTTVEPIIAIISACLPNLQPLVRMVFGSKLPPNTTPDDSVLTTIGGSGGNKQTWSLGNVKDHDGTESFERLNETESASSNASLTPAGYSDQRKNQISIREEHNDAAGIDAHPMYAIRVKKDLDWNEQKS